MKTLRNTGKYPFYYVTFPTDSSDEAETYMVNTYNIQYVTPTVFYDGGYSVLVGGSTDTSWYAGAIRSTGYRTTHDIYLSLRPNFVDDSTITIDYVVTSNGLTNNPPQVPTLPSGSAIRRLEQAGQYSTHSIDLDGDSIYYRWSFGGGDSSSWMGPYKSGDTCMVGHAWSSVGAYNLTAIARDRWLDPSTAWADSLLVLAYLCGDANADGTNDISDAVSLIQYIFVPGSPAPNPLVSGDANCDSTVDISDAVFLIQYIFVPGSPAPCPTC